MVTTRSMSKKIKNSDTEIVPGIRVAKRVRKKGTSAGRYPTIEDDALNIFVINDYDGRYLETHPWSNCGRMPDETIHGGRVEWLNMSDS
ncbi:uncharacterized protein LOC141724349 isoform X2 [Apium graveolens]